MDGWLIPKYAKTSFVMPIALYGHTFAMFAPMLASIIMLKSSNKRKLLDWFWSKKFHYLITFIIFFCTLYFIPASFFSIFDKDLKWRSLFNNYDCFFICSYIAFGWLAGIGEEYGWSGYLLTEWSDKIGKGRAVVVSGVLRGFWHLPLLAIPVMQKVHAGEKTVLGLLLSIVVFSLQLCVSNIFFSALFGYVWYKTKSIPLLGWMHFLFDLGRDFSLYFILGFGKHFWFKYGWGIPFLSLAYVAFQRIVRLEGYSTFLELFYKKKSA